MALREFKCTRCDDKFTAPDFSCKDGRKHEIEAKVYYAPAHSLRMYVTDDCIETLPDGHKRNKLARYVQFVVGRYQTSDPEDQYTLDRQLAEGGLISKEEWERLHYKPEDILKEKLKAAEERLSKYENPVLDQQKAIRGK